MEEGRPERIEHPWRGSTNHQPFTIKCLFKVNNAWNNETLGSVPSMLHRTTKEQIIWKELGANYVGTTLYKSRMFRLKGWKGNQRSTQRNSSYKTSLLARSDITRSSGQRVKTWNWLENWYCPWSQRISKLVIIEIVLTKSEGMRALKLAD